MAQGHEYEEHNLSQLLQFTNPDFQRGLQYTDYIPMQRSDIPSFQGVSWVFYG